MLTFAALMSIITGAVMLWVWADDIWHNGFRPNPEDRIVDIFASVGFSCVIVMGGYQIFMLHY